MLTVKLPASPARWDAALHVVPDDESHPLLDVVAAAVSAQRHNHGYVKTTAWPVISNCNLVTDYFCFGFRLEVTPADVEQARRVIDWLSVFVAEQTLLHGTDPIPGYVMGISQVMSSGRAGPQDHGVVSIMPSMVETRIDALTAEQVFLDRAIKLPNDTALIPHNELVLVHPKHVPNGDVESWMPVEDYIVDYTRFDIDLTVLAYRFVPSPVKSPRPKIVLHTAIDDLGNAYDFYTALNLVTQVNDRIRVKAFIKGHYIREVIVNGVSARIKVTRLDGVARMLVTKTS